METIATFARDFKSRCDWSIVYILTKKTAGFKHWISPVLGLGIYKKDIKEEVVLKEN